MIESRLGMGHNGGIAGGEQGLYISSHATKVFILVAG